ncbi:MAG: adenine phosphoribosyltransferase [Clostridia bacterium]|nr:adenine phosphoribosyltransferase [Clostridia bacterium]
MKSLEEYVRNINDFPKKGIIYRDVTTVLSDADGLKLAIDSMQKLLENTEFDVIVAPESRGFIFGMPLAYNMNKAFVPVRKKGKLPAETISEDYDLEYGSATLEIHKDAIRPGQKVVIIDDLVATGGTLQAIIKLVERLGGQVVKICSLIELVDLNARELLKGYEIGSCIEFKGE